MSLHLPHARIVPNLLQTAHDFANGSFGGFSFAGDMSNGGVSPISRAHALSQTSTLFLHEPPLRHKACATSYTSGSFPYKLDIGEWRITCAGLPARITRFKSKVLGQTKKKKNAHHTRNISMNQSVLFLYEFPEWHKADTCIVPCWSFEEESKEHLQRFEYSVWCYSTRTTHRLLYSGQVAAEALLMFFIRSCVHVRVVVGRMVRGSDQGAAESVA